MRKKLHHVAVHHDYIRLFVICYITISAILAIFLGLFYFLLWIIFHLVLELYKRKHLFGELRLDDFLVALQHARVDIMFFFLGVAIEALAHYSFAIAAGRAEALIRLEKEAQVLLREGRLLEFLRTLPRVFGTIKATKSIAHITEQLIFHKLPKEKRYFKPEKIDFIILAVVIASLAASVIIPLSHGSSFQEILENFVEILSP
jgi:hypothetical protein